MSTQTTRLMHDIIAAWNSHDLDRISAIYAPDYEGIDVAYATPRQGREHIRQTLSLYLAAFPDMHFEVEEMVVQENQAAIAWIGRGTHRGKLMNIPPTGREIVVRGSSFFKVNQDQIVSGLHIWDVAGALRSIGLLPELY